MVAGDFNHDESTLPQIALWKQHGWVEAQQLALALWQQQPQPTCKGATQRDLIFLSPEAAALTQRVRIKDVYMEHSSVIVDLWTKTQQQQIRRWRQPAAIPWDSVKIPGWHSASFAPIHEQGTPTEWYQHFAYSFENSLNGYVELDHNAAAKGVPNGRNLSKSTPRDMPSNQAAQARRPSCPALPAQLCGNGASNYDDSRAIFTHSDPT